MKLTLIGRIAAAALALQLMATAAHATLVSAPFSEGFIGRYTNNAHQPTGIKTFNTLGIARAYLQQDTSNGQFGGVQGNDLTANLKLVFTNGTVINVPGAINWRDGANPLNGVGFIPDNTYTGSFSYGAGLTYDMNGLSVTAADNKYSSFLVQLNTSAITYVDNTSVGGNAALNATAWTALNNYLATTVSSRPAGPVAVVSQSTTDTTPHCHRHCDHTGDRGSDR